MKALLDKVSIANSKKTTNIYSTSFSLGISLLDKSIQDAIYAIYGFVRFADEIVDSLEGYNQRELLDRYVEDTWQAIEKKISLNPILNSFQWVVNKYNIDFQLIQAFIDSMYMDIDTKNHNQNSYKKYILGSAEVVGLMCLYVFTEGSQKKYEELKPYAMSLGSAFQKVNFLRDLKEDTENLQRKYFPELQAMNFNETSKALIIEDIEKDFKHALEGIKKLPKNSRFGVFIAYSYYRELLKKIKNIEAHKIKTKRIRISNFRKIILIPESFIRLRICS